ncbi:MAG: hypothetical protein ACKVX7_06355 [Planctomycetota bacterium]
MLNERRFGSWLLLVVLLFAAPANAAEVLVTATGEVEFDGIPSGPLGAVSAGESVTLSFRLDTDIFMDSGTFNTRGYPLVAGSFELAFSSASIGLQSPFPTGQMPFFVIRNNDPGVDGFFVATSIDYPNGVPIAQAGVFEQFRNNFYVTYGGTTLDSLAVEDALGSYDFTGLTVFNWTIDDGPFNAMIMIFESMTIELVATVPEFRRADSNSDGGFDISDAIFSLSALFVAGAPMVACADAADSNDDGLFDIADAIHMLAALFVSGSPAPAPPGPMVCGPDPTTDSLLCASYAPACP